MAHDFAQRRRVALAMAITVIAVPAAFLLNRSSGNAEPASTGTAETLVGTVPPAGGSVGAGAPVTESSPDDTDALGTAQAGYLSGTTVPGDVSAAQIAVPRLPESVRGLATFSSTIVVSGGVPPIDETHCTLRLLSRLVTVMVALNGTCAASA